MRFSVNWLSEWAAFDVGAAELAERLTGGGLEVDSLAAAAAPLSGVVVGEILACAPHPDADKLKVCSVATGDGEPVQVVCGAPNARAGLKIAFAPVGAELAGGARIERARLRGVESMGMACSARELGLSDDHSGLLELPQDAPLGVDLDEFLGLDDHVIELDLTPNRGDCLGIAGLARDVAAILRVDYTPLHIEPVAPASEATLDIELADPVDCPRYAGRIIRGIDPAAPTPLWMVERLRRCGIRSISAVVDATNYVLMELGQPLHAFDLDKLSGGIVVRRGRPGETLTLLDGKQVELDAELLAICDARGPVALAGIMGGLDSGVGEGTTDILLESAWFKPATISGRARALGLHTDASHRFERGVDAAGQERAIERVTALLLEMAGGEAGPLLLAESAAHLPANPVVNLRLARLNRVLGTAIPAAEVSEILGRLGMRAEATGDGWRVTAPPARFDIAIEEDLIEEIARIHGYDRLPSTPPAGELQTASLSERRVAVTQVQDALCAAGYQEVVTYSFVHSQLLKLLHLDEHVLPLANPISTDMDVMRTALLPGLLATLRQNLRRQQERVRMFETGKVFLQGDRLEEPNRVAAVACGLQWPEQWGVAKRQVDFYDLKGDLEALLDLRGSSSTVSCEAAAKPWLHPGQAATVTLDGQAAGWLGALHPALLAQLDIRSQVFAFELDLDLLQTREVPYAKEISQFPSVRRDLAFIVPEAVKYSEINALVTEIAGGLLANLVVFDQFSGQNVEKGYKSLAIGLILQDVSCTLTDEVVDSLIDRVIKGLRSTLDAQLRG